MKFIFLLSLILLVGCFHYSYVDPPSAFEDPPECATVAISRGTTGPISYWCKQFSCNAMEVPFRCEFHNEGSQRQPGPAIRLVLYSKKTGDVVMISHPIYALPMDSGEIDTKFIFLDRMDLMPNCGYNLERCVVLLEEFSQ